MTNDDLDLLKQQGMNIMDYGLLNCVMQGYLSVAMENIGLDQKTRRKLMEGLERAFDDYSAEEAEQYLFTGGRNEK